MLPGETETATELHGMGVTCKCIGSLTKFLLQYVGFAKVGAR